MTTHSSSLKKPQSRSAPHSAPLAALAGTVVEYYDYALYGFMASCLTAQFFAPTDTEKNLLSVYLIFATSFFAKPLGALVFGYLGDKKGRLWSLSWNMLGMGVVSLCMALLPVYETVGDWAVVGLLMCRFLQGLFMGAEYDGVSLYIYEKWGAQRPCLANSVVCVSALLGICLASWACDLALENDPQSQNWRFLLIIGGFCQWGVLAARMWVFRHDSKFTPKLCPSELTPKLNIKKHMRAFLFVMIMCGVSGGLYHVLFVYLPPHLMKTMPGAGYEGLQAPALLTIYSVLLPLAGLLGDRWGPVTVLKIGLYGLGVSCLGFFEGSPLFVSFATISSIVFFALFMTPTYVILARLFPIHIRYRLVSLGHCLGSIALSGTAPFWCQWLWMKTSLPMAPILYILEMLLVVNVAFMTLFSPINQRALPYD